MAQTVSIIVGAEDRARLVAILGDRNRPLKHIQRVNIIVLSAERLAVQEVARRAGVSRPTVWRWQVRYAEQGVDGLLRDKMRKPVRAPLPTIPDRFNDLGLAGLEQRTLQPIENPFGTRVSPM